MADINPLETFLRSKMKKLILGIVMILTVGCSDIQKYSIGDREFERRDFTTSPEKKYNQVSLKAIVDKSTSYNLMDVSFMCIFDKRDENVWVPAYTLFTPETHMSFSVWPENARLWLLSERKRSVPTLYIAKDSPNFKKLFKFNQYSMMEVRGTVSSVFSDIAFIGVDDVVEHSGPSYTADAIKLLVDGFDLLQKGNDDQALAKLTKALETTTAKVAVIDASFAIGSILERKKDYANALLNFERAYGLEKREDIAKAIAGVKKMLEIQQKIDKVNKKEEEEKDKKLNELDQLLKQKDAKLNETQNELKKQEASSKTALADKDKQIDATTKENTDLKTKVAELTTKLTEAENKLKTDSQEKDKKISDMEKTNKDIADKNKELEEKSSKQIEENKNLTAKVKELEDEITKSKDLKDKNKELEEKLNKQTEENKNLAAKNKELVDEIAKSKDLKEKNKELEEKFKKQEGENQNLSTRVKDLENDLKKYANQPKPEDMQALKDKVSDLTKSNEKLKGENDQLRSEKGDIEKKLRLEYEKKLADMTKTIEGLRNEIDSLVKEMMLMLEK